MVRNIYRTFIAARSNKPHGTILLLQKNFFLLKVGLHVDVHFLNSAFMFQRQPAVITVYTHHYLKHNKRKHKYVVQCPV